MASYDYEAEKTFLQQDKICYSDRRWTKKHDGRGFAKDPTRERERGQSKWGVVRLAKLLLLCPAQGERQRVRVALCDAGGAGPVRGFPFPHGKSGIHMQEQFLAKI